MDENINIQDYQDFENVTIAQYIAAKSSVEESFINSIKHGKIKEALKYAGLYIELDKLLSKRIAYGSKNGYNKQGHSK